MPIVPYVTPAEPASSDASAGPYGVSLLSIGTREPGRVVRLPPSGAFEIGRLEECDLTLAEMAVSASHCKIHVRLDKGGGEPTVTVEDCSTNGTYLGAERIAKGKRVGLIDGDRLGLLRPCGRDARCHRWLLYTPDCFIVRGYVLGDWVTRASRSRRLAERRSGRTDGAFTFTCLVRR